MSPLLTQYLALEPREEVPDILPFTIRHVYQEPCFESWSDKRRQTSKTSGGVPHLTIKIWSRKGSALRAQIWSSFQPGECPNIIHLSFISGKILLKTCYVLPNCSILPQHSGRFARPWGRMRERERERVWVRSGHEWNSWNAYDRDESLQAMREWRLRRGQGMQCNVMNVALRLLSDGNCVNFWTDRQTRLISLICFRIDRTRQQRKPLFRTVVQCPTCFKSWGEYTLQYLLSLPTMIGKTSKFFKFCAMCFNPSYETNHVLSQEAHWIWWKFQAHTKWGSAVGVAFKPPHPSESQPSPIGNALVVDPSTKDREPFCNSH